MKQIFIFYASIVNDDDDDDDDDDDCYLFHIIPIHALYVFV